MRRAFPKLCSPHLCAGMGFVKGPETCLHVRGRGPAGTGMRDLWGWRWPAGVFSLSERGLLSVKKWPAKFFSGKYCWKTCQRESTDNYPFFFFSCYLSVSCSLLAQAILVEEGLSLRCSLVLLGWRLLSAPIHGWAVTSVASSSISDKSVRVRWNNLHKVVWNRLGSRSMSSWREPASSKRSRDLKSDFCVATRKVFMVDIYWKRVVRCWCIRRKLFRTLCGSVTVFIAQLTNL